MLDLADFAIRATWSLDREEKTAGMSPEAMAKIEAAWGYMDGLSKSEDEQLRTLYGTEDESAGRKVLVYATRFPILLVLAFGAIFLFFRSRGGYRPKELVDQASHSA